MAPGGMQQDAEQARPDEVCAMLNATEKDPVALLLSHPAFHPEATSAIDPFGESAWFALRCGQVVGPGDEGDWAVLGPLEMFAPWDLRPR